MPAGCNHTVIAQTELKLIEIQIGKEISVQDKEKSREISIRNTKRPGIHHDLQENL